MPEENPTNPTTPAAPATPATTPPATPAAPAAVDPSKTFTQAELDQIISERLARVKATPPADYDQLRAAAAELEKLKTDQMSDTEKLTKAAALAEERARAAEEKATNALMRAAIVSAAQRAGAVDPDAVLALVDRSTVKVGDDGQVTGVDEAVKALLDSKQYLVGKAPTPTPGGADAGPRGAGPSVITRDSLKAMTPQQVAQLMTTNPADVNRALAGT